MEQVLGILNKIIQKQLILSKYILLYSLSLFAHPTTTFFKERGRAALFWEQLFVSTSFSYATFPGRFGHGHSQTDTPAEDPDGAAAAATKAWPCGHGKAAAMRHTDCCAGGNPTTSDVQALMVSERTKGLLLEIKILLEMFKLCYGSRCRHCLAWVRMTKSGH